MIQLHTQGYNHREKWKRMLITLTMFWHNTITVLNTILAKGKKRTVRKLAFNNLEKG